MSGSDSDNDNFLSDDGPTKASTMTAAKKAIIKDIADEFGNKELAELPFTLHGVEPLSGGRLNLRRVFVDQYKQLANEREEEDKQRKQLEKLKLQQQQQQFPARRQREEETTNNSKKKDNSKNATVKEDQELQQKEKSNTNNNSILPLTFLELCQGTSYGPQIVLSDERRNLIRWNSTTTTTTTKGTKNKDEEDQEEKEEKKKCATSTKHQFPISVKTTRICSCCGRLARYRCPVCFAKMNSILNNNTNSSDTNNNNGDDDKNGSSKNFFVSLLSTTAGGIGNSSSSSIFSDPDGGLVCSQACLELHAATRCGKHVQ